MLKILTALLSILTCLSKPEPLSVSSAAEKPLPILAHYRFDKDGRDTTGVNPDFQLVNAPLKDGSLYLNGLYENGGAGGYVAKCRTNELDYSHFTVAMRFRAEEFSVGKENLLTGGLSYRWFGMNSLDKHLNITLNNQDFTHRISDAPLEAGKWTTVACGVDLPTRDVVVYFNGKKVDDFLLPEDFKLEIIDSDMRDKDRFWTFTNYSNGSVFHGQVSELAIYSRQLTAAEFAGIRFAESDAAKDSGHIK